MQSSNKRLGFFLSWFENGKVSNVVIWESLYQPPNHGLRSNGQMPLHPTTEDRAEDIYEPLIGLDPQHL